MQKQEVGNKRNVHQHVPVEYKSTGWDYKDSIHWYSHCMRCRIQRIIHNSVRLLNVLRLVRMQQHTQYVTKNLMHALVYSIWLRIPYGSGDIVDCIEVQELSELEPHVLQPLIVNNLHWYGITKQQSSLHCEGHIICRRRWNSYKFREVGHRVDNRNRSQFESFATYLNYPWYNGIDRYVVPWMYQRLPFGKLNVASPCCLIFLTCSEKVDAVLDLSIKMNVMKNGPNSLKQVCLSNVYGNLMIPRH